MARIEAVYFDLFETLMTEYDSEWRPRPTPAERFGVNVSSVAVLWRERRDARMTSAHGEYRDVLRAIRAALGQCNVDDIVPAQLQAVRLSDKAAPFERGEQKLLQMAQAVRQVDVKH